MSLRKLPERCEAREQCEQTLFVCRWPRGLVCAESGHMGGSALQGRRLSQWHLCARQTSVTRGTLCADSKLALNVWLLAAQSMTQARNGISSLQLSHQLGIWQNSARLMKHKLMQPMLEREGTRQPGGLVQLDDGHRGWRRRGTCGKTPFVPAEDTDAPGHPRRMSLDCVMGFGSSVVARWNRARLTAVLGVQSDGLACFVAGSPAGWVHIPTVMSVPGIIRRRQAPDWADTMLDNFKNAIHGTQHAVGSRHLPHNLGQFSRRVNGRTDLASMLAKLATAAAQTPPMPFRLESLPEAHRQWSFTLGAHLLYIQT